MTMRILIVEDEAGCAVAVRRFLEPYSSRVEHSDSLRGAFAFAKNFQFDLIVLDGRLRDSTIENTINAIPDLRALQPHAGVVFISGILPVEEYREKALAAGADAYVAKGHDFTAAAIYVATLAAVRQRHNGDTASRIMDQIGLLEKLVHA